MKLPDFKTEEEISFWAKKEVLIRQD